MAPLERLEHNTIALWTGILGTTLFFGLFAGALIRLAVHMRRNVTSPPVFRRCHVVIVLYSALDIPRFAVTLFKGVAVEYQSGLLPRIVYSMHLLSMWLQVVALTMIILMWAAVFTGRGARSKAAAFRARCIPRFFFALMLVVMLVATIVVIVPLLLIRNHEYLSHALDDEKTYFPFVITSSSCLFVCAAGILGFGLRMHFGISRHVWQASSSRRVVRRLLRSFNITMAVCTAMFALRIGMLLSLFDAAVRDNAALNELEWQCLSYWIPTIVPAVVLLAFMKAGSTRPTVSSPTMRASVRRGGASSVSSRRSTPSLLQSDTGVTGPRTYGAVEEADFSAAMEPDTPVFDGLASDSYGHSATYHAMPTSPLRQPPV